jgi:hypothetical protein
MPLHRKSQTKQMANKAVLDNRLPVPRRDDSGHYNLQAAVEGAPPLGGARPWTLGKKTTKHK